MYEYNIFTGEDLIDESEIIIFSQITINELKKHLNIEPEFLDDDNFLRICLTAAKEYVLSYTNLSVEQLDKIYSINIATLLLASDFYSRRNAGYGYDDNRINFMLKSILDMHKNNWL